MKKIFKFALAIIILAISTISLLPSSKAENTNTLDVNQYATKEQLTNNTFALKNGDKIGKINFGDKKWLLGGTDADGTVTILCTTPFLSSQTFNEDRAGEGIYVRNDFNISDIFALLKSPQSGLYTSHFTQSQIALMCDVQVKYYDQGAVTSSGERSSGGPTLVSNKTKLYIPDAEDNNPFNNGTSIGRVGVNNPERGRQTDTIYIGKDNTLPVYLPALSGQIDENTFFWLRSAFYYNYNNAFVATTKARMQDGYNDNILYAGIDNQCSLLPAANLDFTNVSFASAATLPSNITSEEKGVNIPIGDILNLRFAEGMGNKGEIGDLISVEKDGKTCGLSVSLSQNTNTTESMYVVFQNSDNAWARKVVDGDYIDFDNISFAENGSNGKVWIETTTDGITMSTQPKDVWVSKDGIFTIANEENKSVDKAKSEVAIEKKAPEALAKIDEQIQPMKQEKIKDIKSSEMTNQEGLKAVIADVLLKIKSYNWINSGLERKRPLFKLAIDFAIKYGYVAEYSFAFVWFVLAAISIIKDAWIIIYHKRKVASYKYERPTFENSL